LLKPFRFLDLLTLTYGLYPPKKRSAVRDGEQNLKQTDHRGGPVLNHDRNEELGHHHSPDHGHAHAHFERADLPFIIGILLNIAFVIAEIAFGILADSMALLTDAAHNVSDVLGLALAWWAASLARKKPTDTRTYGYRKAGILAALANATIILVAVGGIAWEAAVRIADPPATQGNLIILTATVGVVINTFAALLFLKGRKHDINLRAACMHLAADAAVSVGVVVAGAAILLTGRTWIDPAVSLAITVVIVLGTWSLLKSSLALAMDAVPPHIDIRQVRTYLINLPGARNVHDLHIWAMSPTETALTAHICTDAPWPTERLLEIGADLKNRFATGHVTIQVEPHDDCMEPCPQDGWDTI
jgi:cobalt-zinc-cadmium efflux system protein